MSDVLPTTTEETALPPVAEQPPLVNAEFAPTTTAETISPRVEEQPPLASAEFMPATDETPVAPVAPLAEALQALNLAIEIYPRSAVNYLYRAELFMAQQQWALAQADLVTARDLAQRELEEDAWGFAAQVVLDRAERALAQFTE
jgi:hypothetical protein